MYCTSSQPLAVTDWYGIHCCYELLFSFCGVDTGFSKDNYFCVFPLSYFYSETKSIVTKHNINKFCLPHSKGQCAFVYVCVCVCVCVYVFVYVYLRHCSKTCLLSIKHVAFELIKQL